MRIVLLLAACGLTACAGMDAAECRGANWYELGFRDAIFSLQPQDSLYGPQCSQHGVQLDAANYAKGWQEGKYEFERRTAQSQD